MVFQSGSTIKSVSFFSNVRRHRLTTWGHFGEHFTITLLLTSSLYVYFADVKDSRKVTPWPQDYTIWSRLEWSMNSEANQWEMISYMYMWTQVRSFKDCLSFFSRNRIWWTSSVTSKLSKIARDGRGSSQVLCVYRQWNDIDGTLQVKSMSFQRLTQKTLSEPVCQASHWQEASCGQNVCTVHCKCSLD